MENYQKKTMSSEQKLEEQVLSQVIETTITNQLDEVDEIDIDIQTDFFKIFQGQAQGVAVAGQGLVMQDVRVQEIQLQTDTVDVNPLSAIFGKVELNKPVNANARLVFTEADLNRAFASSYVRSKLQKFELNVNGEIVTFKPLMMEIYLPEANKLKFIGKVEIQTQGNTRQLTFQATARPRVEEQPIILESFVCAEGEGISLDVAAALMQKVKELTRLPYLKLEDVTFRIKKMIVEKGSMTLMVQAHLRQIPSM